MKLMKTPFEQFSFSPIVGIARLGNCSYPERPSPGDQIFDAIHRVSECMRWANERGPFGTVIPRGARVLVKPNLVMHQNEGSGGIDPLVTHPSLIRATVESVLQADPAEVLVGDAPIQSCNLPWLLQSTGLDSWARDLTGRDPRFKGIQDFRRTTCVVSRGVRRATEALQPAERFALFNLGSESLLEPVTEDRRFRVTWYDPRLMAKTHRQGFHQYLVAREVLEADVVINLPKLKTHKKAGVTCALKNSVGINGNKEYLPHHRLGGSATGGDCYPGGSPLKRVLEHFADRQNLTSSVVIGTFWHALAAGMSRMSRWQGDQLGVDGSWSGNDTIWRTCLDLNRILLYGSPHATMKDNLQRRVIHVIDAVVAGQGNGPLAPDPLHMGLILASENAVAADWVGARLLAYEPSKIPIVRQAFNKFRWPLVSFASTDVRVTGDLGEGSAERVVQVGDVVDHPIGWRDAAAACIDPDSRRGSKAENLTPWDA